MKLAVQAFRFHFHAVTPVTFGPGKLTNVFRGALGNMLRKQACPSSCPGAARCKERFVCPYARLFEPHQSSGPSGLADPPRPFVLRADSLEPRVFQTGAGFFVDVHFFDLSLPALRYFALAFDLLGGMQLQSIVSISDGRVVFEEGKFSPSAESCTFEVPLTSSAEASAATLTFLTPMELKHEGGLLREPRFDVIFARARDRISTLCTLYQANTLPLDYAGLAEQSRQVRLVASDLSGMSWLRTSSRTGLTNELRGFMGRATYEGPLTELLPILRAAYWTGIGRQTVWGLGAVQVC